MNRMHHRRGLTLIESMIVVVILGVVTLGVGIGLQGATRLCYATDTRLAIHARLLEKLEQIHTASFSTLTAAVGVTNNSLCDTVTVNGKSLARTVSVAYFDVDGGGAENDIVEVAVTINGQTLKTRVCKP